MTLWSVPGVCDLNTVLHKHRIVLGAERLVEREHNGHYALKYYHRESKVKD
jgi:hypothetical protein